MAEILHPGFSDLHLGQKVTLEEAGTNKVPKKVLVLFTKTYELLVAGFNPLEGQFFSWGQGTV